MNTKPYSDTINGINLVKNMLAPQRGNWLVKQWEDTAARMGQKYVASVNAQDDFDPVIDIALEDYRDLIIHDYSHYSQGEIADVLKRGAQGQFGENFSISSKAITTWFRIYSTTVRFEIAKAYEQEQSKFTKTLPEPKKPEYTKQDAIKHLQEAYEDYHNGEIILAWSYDIAVKFDLLPEKYQDLSKTVIRAQEIVREQQAKKLGKGHISRSEYLRIIQDVSDGTPLDQAMRKVALGEWFDWMKLGTGFKTN